MPRITEHLTHFQCDRCAKYFKPNAPEELFLENFRTWPVLYVNTEKAHKDTLGTETPIEDKFWQIVLCPECASSFMDWLANDGEWLNPYFLRTKKFKKDCCSRIDDGKKD